MSMVPSMIPQMGSGYNVDRLLNKIRIDTETSCWEWTGYRDVFGYGRFSVNGKPIKAHRAMWLALYGYVPRGDRCLMHRCDNPGCVNPTHLEDATRYDNMMDMTAKGRASRGERNSHAILRAEDVLAIRAMMRTGRWQFREVAGMFGVDEATVHCANSGHSWSHLPGANKKVANV